MKFNIVRLNHNEESQRNSDFNPNVLYESPKSIGNIWLKSVCEIINVIFMYISSW